MKKTLQTIIATIIICVFSGLFFSYLHNGKEKNDHDNQLNMLSEVIDQKKYFIYRLHAFLFPADNELTIKKQTEGVYEILQVYDKIVVETSNSTRIKDDLDSFVELVKCNKLVDGKREKIEGLFASMHHRDKNDMTNKVMLAMNYILDEFIDAYIYSTYPVSELQIVNIARQDTVKYGEYYESQILYDILDLTREKMIVIGDNDTLQDGTYREQALCRGKNRREGKQYFVFKDRLQIFGFEIEYYVE